MGIFGSKKKKGEVYATTTSSGGAGGGGGGGGGGWAAAANSKQRGRQGQDGDGAVATHNVTRSMSISTPSKVRNRRFKSAAIAVIAANRLMRVKPEANQKCIKLVGEHFGSRAGSVKPAVLEEYIKDNRLELIQQFPYKRQNLIMTVGSHLSYVAENS
jgi:hypothetical protein